MSKCLFIHHLLVGDFDNLRWWMLAVGIMAAMVIIASCIDLLYGIRASKAAGVFKTSSYGLRKTVEKDKDYMIFLFFAMCIDGCFSFVFDAPFCCVVIAAAEILIEGVSVMENRHRIGVAGADALDVARAIIKTFGISDMSKIEEVAKYIKTAKHEQEEAKDIEPLSNDEL